MLHLRVELKDSEEIENWETIKAHFGIKSNTETLRAIISQIARELKKL